VSSSCRLSICIPTLNRGDFIGETLESIVNQLSDEVEIVIIDGGSTDQTEDVVRRYAERFGQIQYVKKSANAPTPSNEGFDRDCNAAVELARGTYCWLMTDDDLLTSGAVSEVLRQIAEEPDLLLVSARICNVDFSNVLVASLPDIAADRSYSRSTWASFASEVGAHLTFLGRVIIKRAVWLRRERERYFGSGFIHVGVILAEPLDRIVMLAEPLVVVRYGNGLWRSRAFDIWMHQWPSLVWSMESIPESAKAAVTERHPFRSLKRLLWYRALGAYSIQKYRQRLAGEPNLRYRLAAASIARLPIVFANALCWLYLLPVRSRSVSMQLYDLLRCGYAAPFTRRLARLKGVY
jgi:glycosyltransferase involved in cell wall biosynthesis